NEYLDLRCGLGPISLGHRFPAVEAAVREELERGLIFSYASPLEVEVARRLVEIVPCAESVRFLKSGGEAIKLARAFTGRERVLKCGYHGWLQMTAGPGIPGSVGDSLRDMPWGEIA